MDVLYPKMKFGASVTDLNPFRAVRGHYRILRNDILSWANVAKIDGYRGVNTGMFIICGALNAFLDDYQYWFRALTKEVEVVLFLKEFDSVTLERHGSIITVRAEIPKPQWVRKGIECICREKQYLIILVEGDIASLYDLKSGEHTQERIDYLQPVIFGETIDEKDAMALLSIPVLSGDAVLSFHISGRAIAPGDIWLVATVNGPRYIKPEHLIRHPRQPVYRHTISPEKIPITLSSDKYAMIGHLEGVLVKEDNYEPGCYTTYYTLGKDHPFLEVESNYEATSNLKEE